MKIFYSGDIELGQIKQGCHRQNYTFGSKFLVYLFCAGGRAGYWVGAIEFSKKSHRIKKMALTCGYPNLAGQLVRGRQNNLPIRSES
jgi:hypothetical protein